MQHRCPVCNENIETIPKKEIICNNCHCTLSAPGKGQIEIVKSGIGVNVFNLVLGILIISGFLFILTELAKGNIRILHAGFIFLVFPVVLIIRELILRNKKDYYSTLGLYKALHKKTIGYYDFASKILIFSIFSIQFLGILMIVYGLLLKV